jgi:hypothetical protein
MLYVEARHLRHVGVEEKAIGVRAMRVEIIEEMDATGIGHRVHVE